MTTLDTLFQTVTQRHPDRLALAWKDREMTYRDLGVTVERLAVRLAGVVDSGHRLGILAPNAPALIAGLFAAWRLGAVAVPLNARWREYELGRILRDAEVTALVSVESYHGYDFARLFSELSPSLPTLRLCLLVDAAGDVTGDLSASAAEWAAPLGPDLGILLYTSGTTGDPKGALTRHQAEVDGARALNDVLGTSAEDVGLLVIPIAHAFGLGCFLAAFAAGALAVLIDSTFSTGPLLAALRRHRATLLHGPPVLFRTLLRAAPPGLATLRNGFVAGASCPPQILEQLDDAGLKILNLYGMTEIGAATCCRPGDSARVRRTTVGSPLPGVTLRIQGGGPIGEVQVRGPSVTPGYYRQPEQTAAALDDGWFRTGDLGGFDELGNLILLGRTREVIQVAGLNVFPAEVEAVLLSHPDVLHAVVVGVPHEAMGEVPHAFVVLRPEADLKPQALLRFMRSRIAGYKLPYMIRMLPELPLLVSGKPDRAALRRSV
jgi:acyl-CoA synthetase (AMP-forming)/AMP-acid ligase II